MTPYYQDEHVTLYHGDNREILPALVAERGLFDLCLTDPPYGIGKWTPTGGFFTKESCAKIKGWDRTTPDTAALQAVIASARYAIVWGGNYLSGHLGGCRMPLLWDKKIRGMHFADGEYAWTNFDYGTLRIFEFAASKSDARGRRIHPTQKPLALMKWCIGLVRGDAQTIVDPYAGSCSTGVAAKQMGRRAVLIERDEQYCEAGAKRLADVAAQAELEPDAPKHRAVFGFPLTAT